MNQLMFVPFAPYAVPVAPPSQPGSHNVSIFQDSSTEPWIKLALTVAVAVGMTLGGVFGSAIIAAGVGIGIAVPGILALSRLHTINSTKREVVLDIDPNKLKIKPISKEDENQYEKDYLRCSGSAKNESISFLGMIPIDKKTAEDNISKIKNLSLEINGVKAVASSKYYICALQKLPEECVNAHKMGESAECYKIYETKHSHLSSLTPAQSDLLKTLSSQTILGTCLRVFSHALDMIRVDDEELDGASSLPFLLLQKIDEQNGTACHMGPLSYFRSAEIVTSDCVKFMCEITSTKKNPSNMYFVNAFPEECMDSNGELVSYLTPVYKVLTARVEMSMKYDESSSLWLFDTCRCILAVTKKGCDRSFPIV